MGAKDSRKEGRTVWIEDSDFEPKAHQMINRVMMKDYIGFKVVQASCFGIRADMKLTLRCNKCGKDREIKLSGAKAESRRCLMVRCTGDQCSNRIVIVKARDESAENFHVLSESKYNKYRKEYETSGGDGKLGEELADYIQDVIKQGGECRSRVKKH